MIALTNSNTPPTAIPTMPERQQDQPDKRISNHRQQGQWPAYNQKNAPQKKFRHDLNLDLCHPNVRSFRSDSSTMAWVAIALNQIIPSISFQPVSARAFSPFFRSAIAFFRSFSGSANVAFVRFGSFSKINSCARRNSSSISLGRSAFHRSSVTQ